MRSILRQAQDDASGLRMTGEKTILTQETLPPTRSRAGLAQDRLKGAREGLLNPCNQGNPWCLLHSVLFCDFCGYHPSPDQVEGRLGSGDIHAGSGMSGHPGMAAANIMADS